MNTRNRSFCGAAAVCGRHFLFVMAITMGLPALLAAQNASREDSVVAMFLNPELGAAQRNDSGVVQQMESAFCCQKKQLGVIGVEMFALEIMPWFFNRHVSDDSTADLSIESWKRNINTGFEWDNDAFTTNMFAHPYHGNVYFNAARSNGYNFWQSGAFAFAGSFIWEMFGEANHGAVNDWAMTSIGGIGLGEVLHRTAKMVRDNTMQGAGRTGREFAGMLIDPVGGFSRMLRGEMSKVGPNPEDRFPDHNSVIMSAGLRVLGDGRVYDSQSAGGYADLTVVYGDPFSDFDEPFDSFEFGFQFNRQDKVAIGRLSLQGVLWGTELKRSDQVHHVVSINQVFDYMENNAFEVGGQNLALTLNSRFTVSDKVSLVTRAQSALTIIAGVNAEYGEFTGREYDFGSGLGFRLRAQLNRDGYDLFTVGYAGTFTHVLNGAPGNQIVHYASARAYLPVGRVFGVAAEYLLFIRNSYYEDFPNVHRRNPELRISSVFNWR